MTNNLKKNIIKYFPEIAAVVVGVCRLVSEIVDQLQLNALLNQISGSGPPSWYQALWKNNPASFLSFMLSLLGTAIIVYVVCFFVMFPIREILKIEDHKQTMDSKAYEKENFILSEPLTKDEVKVVMIANGNTGTVGANSWLRASEPENLVENIFRWIPTLDRIICKSKINKDMVLVRHLKRSDLLNANKLTWKDLHKGVILEDKGYLEASEKIVCISPDSDTILKIKVKQGTNCLCVAAYAGRENEMGILFPRDAKLKITKVREMLFWNIFIDNQWDWIIECEMIK